MSTDRLVTSETLPGRALAAGAALVALGGAATPGDLGRAAALNETTRKRAITDLRQARLVRGNKGHVELTSAGWVRLRPRPRPDAGALGQALGFWPAGQRAFSELLLSAIVVRHHLADLEPQLGFVAIGNTGLGKSSLAEVVFELFGLDKVQHTRMVPEQSEGDLVGRRVRSSEGMQYEPAAVMGLPVVLFDELDKGDGEQRRAVLTYYQGAVEVMRGDERLTLRPVPVIGSNYPAGPSRFAHLRPELRRRSVVLDVGTDKPTDLEEALRRFYDPPRHPWRGLLVLDELRPPAAAAESLRPLLASVANVLTDAGRGLFVGERALELLSLGRAALYGRANVGEAGLITVADYLTCLSSVEGLVEPDWYEALAGVADQVEAGADRPAFEAALRASRAQREHVVAGAQRKRRQGAQEDLELVGQRAALVAELKERYAGLDGRTLHRSLRPAGAGVRAQLRDLVDRASKVSLPASLAEKRELARAPLAQSAELTARSDQLKRDEAQAQKTARAPAERPRRGPSPDQARAWRFELDGLQRHARALEAYHAKRTTPAGEDPFAVLRRYSLPDGATLLEYQQPPPAPPRPPGWRGYFAHTGADSGTWCSALDRQARYSGSPDACPELSSWGNATRAVIEPALAVLYGQEDQLLYRLGRKAPRRKRVGVTPRHVVAFQTGAIPWDNWAQ